LISSEVVQKTFVEGFKEIPVTKIWNWYMGDFFGILQMVSHPWAIPKTISEIIISF
jgi:hypothetical protein